MFKRFLNNTRIPWRSLFLFFPFIFLILLVWRVSYKFSFFSILKLPLKFVNDIFIHTFNYNPKFNILIHVYLEFKRRLVKDLRSIYNHWSIPSINTNPRNVDLLNPLVVKHSIAWDEAIGSLRSHEAHFLEWKASPITGSNANLSNGF